MNLKNSLTWFFSFISVVTLGQYLDEKTEALAYLDSAKSCYLKYGIEDSLRRFSYKAEKIGRKINNPAIVIKSLTYLGYSYMYDSSETKSPVYFSQALVIAEQLELDSVRGNIKAKLGSFYLNRGKLTESIVYFQESTELYKKAGVIGLQAESHLGLTIVYVDLKDTLGIKTHLHKAMILGEQVTDPINKVVLLTQVASVYQELGQIDELYADTAIFICNSLLPISKKHHMKSRTASLYMTLFNCSFHKEENEDFSAYADSIRLLEPYIIPNNMGLFYTRLARQYQKDRNYKLALKFITMAEDLSDLKNVNQSMNLYTHKHQILRSLGDYEQAYDALLFVNDLKDSLRSSERFSIVKELEEKYESKLKELKIQELEQENIVIAKEIEIQTFKVRNRNWFILTLVISTSLIISILLLFVRHRKISKEKQIIKTKHQLLRSQMNPHFLFNGFAALQKSIMKEDDKVEIVTHLGEFSRIMRSVLESSFNEFILLEEEIKFLNNYLSIQRFRFGSKMTFDISVGEELNLHTLKIPPMLIQPFLENSIDHGMPEGDELLKITVTFKKANDEMIILIDDDGVGFEELKGEKTSHISRAHQIVQERLELVETILGGPASMEIVHKDVNEYGSSGIKVILTLPLISIY